MEIFTQNFFMILVFVLYALFASVFTVAKTGLEFTDPLFLVGSRMVIAGAILIAYIYFRKPEACKIRSVDWKAFFFLALFNIYLTNAFEFWGLKYLTSFKTCFIYSLSPFVAALLSYFLFSEKMTSKKWIGLFVGFIGFFPILLATTKTEEEAGNFFFFSWAELAVMAAAVSSVYGWILLKQLVKEKGYAPTLANGVSMFLGGLFALIHSFATENWDPFPIKAYVPYFECTVLLILISNLICYNLYGYLLKKYTATFMSFAGFSTPFFTALFGWIFLGETVSWPFYLSSAIVFSGLFLYHREELVIEMKYAQSQN